MDRTGVGVGVIWCLIFSWLSSSYCDSENSSHHRQKRLIWITSDGRLALPPGTLLTITPTISLPFVRYPPDGFLSNMSISLPFTINFDTLGLTDNQNPYGALPPLIARSMGRSAGAIFADYVASFISSKRKGRSTENQKMHPSLSSLFHGGERAMLYIVIEEFLENFGMDGRACLLRAVCEVHGHSMTRFGFVGEILKLFLTPSKSPYASVIEDYVNAEKRGSLDGECFPYYKQCPKSLFQLSEPNKYTENRLDETNVNENDNEENKHRNKIDEFNPTVTILDHSKNNPNILDNEIM